MGEKILREPAGEKKNASELIDLLPCLHRAQRECTCY